MMTLEHDGVEQAFADWGFTLDSVQAEHVNLSASRFLAFVPGASVADDPLFDFEDKVIIRANRSGSGTSWSGGYVAFIGYAMSPRASQDGQGAGLVYEFANAWYFLENMVFEQEFASYETGSLEYVYLSDVMLFTKLNAITFLLELQDSGEQIAEILQYASDQAVAAGFAQPYIIGTIDPDIQFPSYQVREMMCAAAVLKCLEASPDVCCWFDYTTELSTVPTPTVHFYKRSSRTSKSLAILNGTDHKRLDIMPRYDLQVRAVNLQYKITGSDDGNVWIIQGAAQRDKYGPNGANHASDPDRGLRVIRQTIDLQGRQTTSVGASIEVAAVDATRATEATRLAWWKKKVQWLNSDKISGLAIDAGSITVKDDAGSTVSLATYPNELTRGQIASWMGFAQKWVTITAKATFNRYATAAAATAATANLAIEKAQEREMPVRILVTDGTTGSYSALGSYVDGEAIPTGIAQSVYNAMSVLQYQGNDVRVQAEIMNPAGDGPLIHLGHKLNLTGGRAAWTTMDAMIQRIVSHYGRGETTISFGPARHLAAGDLAAMFQWNRFRRYWYNPALRETADLGAGGNVELGEDVPKENTSSGSGTEGKYGVANTFEDS